MDKSITMCRYAKETEKHFQTIGKVYQMTPLHMLKQIEKYKIELGDP